MDNGNRNKVRYPWAGVLDRARLASYCMTPPHRMWYVTTIRVLDIQMPTKSPKVIGYTGMDRKRLIPSVAITSTGCKPRCVLHHFAQAHILLTWLRWMA